MYAIVNISGKQFRVESGDELQIPHQDVEPGKKVIYKHVLLLNNGKEIKVGRPTVSGSIVEATVVEHGRGKKVTVFKKKRRKGYRVKNTHRQEFTKIHVDSVKEKATKKKTSNTKKTSTAKAKTSTVKKTIAKKEA